MFNAIWFTLPEHTLEIISSSTGDGEWIGYGFFLFVSITEANNVSNDALRLFLYLLCSKRYSGNLQLQQANLERYTFKTLLSYRATAPSSTTPLPSSPLLTLPSTPSYTKFFTTTY
uniref:Uncharacterized protein n=1 Tax=Glossina austeni TaxID=7395 RepID=A0A1A9UH24_GLOAU